MRKFVIAAALAASTLTAAAPAAAQWYPPQGNAYGYNNYGQVRRLDARIDAIQRQISSLDRRNILSDREADRLRGESRDVERRLHYSARNGLTGWERNDIERRIGRLEYRIQREARDGNRYGYYPAGYSQNGWYDRDRDGLDDRYERDHGTNYDEDHDRD
jgi:opacity protein-like surface antigen